MQKKKKTHTQNRHNTKEPGVNQPDINQIPFIITANENYCRCVQLSITIAFVFTGA